MIWTPITTAPTTGTLPYDWSAATIYECTWFAYWRVQQGYDLERPPCWQTGSGSSGSGKYVNAKYWLEHYRDPWQVKDIATYPDYLPVPGDIIVFDGTYGHVVVVEKVNSNGTWMVTDWNLIGGSQKFGRKSNYIYPNRINSSAGNTGPVLGCLHLPNPALYAVFAKKRRKGVNAWIYQQ